jgi:hypothetical protein
MPDRRQLTIANAATCQRQGESQRVKHCLSQQQAVGEPMEGAHPCPSTETISTLINIDHSWHVNHLQTTIQFNLGKPNIFNKSMNKAW